MDVLNQKQLLESTNCVLIFFSIFFEIFLNFSKNRFEFFEKWTTSSGHPLLFPIRSDSTCRRGFDRHGSQKLPQNASQNGKKRCAKLPPRWIKLTKNENRSKNSQKE
jgi:hypothetical protein